MRPLEQIRAKWYTEENMVLYFKVSRDLQDDAGVAIINLDFDPNLPYSEESLKERKKIILTRRKS